MSGKGEGREAVLGFQSQQRLASGGGNGGDAWRHFSRNMAGALVQTWVQRPTEGAGQGCTMNLGTGGG